jgi:two-component sensor histidine kinase/CheY-like chemotaxis protein
VLDLRSWNFSEYRPAPLVGEWEFFPGVLLRGSEALAASGAETRNVPDSWRFGSLSPADKAAGMAGGMGAGTYRLRVLLPESGTSRLGVRWPTVSTAFELDADGFPSAHARPAIPDPADAVPSFKPSVAALPEVYGQIVLIVRVSNHEYRKGGMWRPFLLGTAETLGRRHWISTVQALALSASLAILAALSAVLFFASGKRIAFLSFSAFALSGALRSLVTGVYAIGALFPNIGFSTVIRLEYLSAFTAYPLGLVFFSVIFPDEVKAGPYKVLLLAASAFLLFLPFAPLRVLTFSLLPYYVLAAAIVASVAILLVRAASHGRPGTIPLFVGGAVIMATSVNDVLFSNFLLDTTNLFPYGLLVFVGSQAYAIARRYVYLQGKLRQILSEKELLIKEVHHRVKNSLQIVSSITSLQASRVSDPAALDAYRSVQTRIRAVSIVHERLYSVEAGNAIDLGEYVRELVDQLVESYGTEGESFSLDTRQVFLPGDLCIDVGLMLTELVANAYKYGVGPDRRGTIRVCFDREEDWLKLSVADDGPGFSDAFVPGKSGTLGFRLILALAKNGTRRSTSRKARELLWNCGFRWDGTVRHSLRRARRTGVRGAWRINDVQEEDTGVEDEPLVGLELKENLERKGYVVPDVIESGEDFDSAVSRYRPDLVLMDIRLKGEMDGIQAASRVKAAFNLPVIYLTAYSDKDTLARAAKTEPAAFLLKPFDERELSANIQMALAKSGGDEAVRRELLGAMSLVDAMEDPA